MVMFQGALYYFKFCREKEKGLLLCSLMYFIVNEFIAVFNIVYPKYIIDGITEDRGIKYITIYTIVFLLIKFALGAMEGLFMHITMTKTHRLSKHFDLHICMETAKADYSVVENDSYIAKRQMVYNYIYAFGMGLHLKLMSIIGSIIRLCSIIVIIATFRIWLIFLLLLMIVINTIIKDIISKKEYKLIKNLEKITRKFNYIKDILKNREYGKEVRINQLADYFLVKARGFSKAIFKGNQTRRRYRYFFQNNIKINTNLLQEGVAYFYLAVNAWNQSISLGSFTMYLNAVSKFSDSMNNLMSHIMDLKNSNLSYQDFKEYMDLPKKMRTGDILVKNTDQKHKIEFQHVSFRYPGNDREVLRDINIVIGAGEKLSIVGENGAGKTTFIKLLIRLYDPTEGEILLDGVNIKKLEYNSYMNTLSVVFQDFKLFSFSIKENIVFQKVNNVKEEEVEHILEKSGLLRNIKKLDKKIDTMLYKEFDDEGVELSGGEGQKLSIARALYKNGGIVILDEPTAALDPRSEYDIYMKFNELVQGKTAIYISHRLSSTKFCDKVAVFENGSIMEYGTHEELLKKNKIYAELFWKQAHFYQDIKN